MNRDKSGCKELQKKIQELENELEFHKIISDYSYDWEVFRDETEKIVYLNHFCPIKL